MLSLPNLGHKVNLRDEFSRVYHTEAEQAGFWSYGVETARQDAFYKPTSNYGRVTVAFAPPTS